jgi:hypothetical protein
MPPQADLPPIHQSSRIVLCSLEPAKESNRHNHGGAFGRLARFPLSRNAPHLRACRCLSSSVPAGIRSVPCSRLPLRRVLLRYCCCDTVLLVAAGSPVMRVSTAAAIALVVAATVVCAALPPPECPTHTEPEKCRAAASCGWCGHRCYNTTTETCCPHNATVCSTATEECCVSDGSFMPSPSGTCCPKAGGPRKCCPAPFAPQCCHGNATCCPLGGPAGNMGCCGGHCVMGMCCDRLVKCGNTQCCPGACGNGHCMPPP